MGQFSCFIIILTCVGDGPGSAGGSRYQALSLQSSHVYRERTGERSLGAGTPSLTQTWRANGRLIRSYSDPLRLETRNRSDPNRTLPSWVYRLTQKLYISDFSDLDGKGCATMLLRNEIS